MFRVWKLYFLLVVFIASISFSHSRAQSLYTDSLKDVLVRTDLEPGNRIMTMGHLARALFETDLKEAIRTGKEALRLSWSMSDGQYGAFTHVTLGYLYVQEDSLHLARQAIDSAGWYAERTDDRIIKGYVQFRKGWLEIVQGNEDKAADYMLEALRTLEGQQAYLYESTIYHYLSSTYAYWNDPGKQEEYARLSLQAALRTSNPDVLCDAYLSIGSSFVYRFRRDTTQRHLLDSALYYNNSVLHIAKQQKDRIIIHSIPAAVALNTANLYFQYFPGSFKDSAEKYINIALPIARQVKHEEIIANCYGIMSEYAMMEGDYDKAEKILLMAVGEIAGDSSSGPLVKARMARTLATVAEKSGDAAKALHYYKEYMQHDKALFDAEKLATVQSLEAQYQSEKKEQALAAAEERAAFNRKLNFFYVCLIIASLFALVFLFRSYHFRLRSSLQQQQLLSREKEEADLQSQLKSTEARQLKLEKQEALLQANLHTEEAGRLQAERQLMQERQERLQKELLAGTLQMEEKNELLQMLQGKITALLGNDNRIIKQIRRIIEQSRRQDEDSENIKADIAEIHPEFFFQLQQNAGNSLTRLDMKYCSYILMRLSNKEIASRLNIEPKSIRMARYRIKQKLGLGKDESLDRFIQSLDKEPA